MRQDVKPLSAAVIHKQDSVRAELVDRRPDVVMLFANLSQEQREQLSTDAWSIGLRALANAHRQGQEAHLQDIGKALLDDIGQQLDLHVQRQQQTITAILGKYFDPTDGQVEQRLRAFIDDRGVLSRLLEKYLAPQNSVLAETLARQVGDQSPLFKRLSTTDSEGLINVLESKLLQVMESGHAELERALDPLAEDGAVARFLKSLREELESADEDRAKQLSAALNALDANDETSLICRLMRETQLARQSLLHAVNPDAADSPMAIMKQTLSALFKEHAHNQEEALRFQNEHNDKLATEVREALARIEGRRTQQKRSPDGGLEFEDAVIDFVTVALQGAPCLVEATGNTAGLRARCKKGDLLVRFTAESAFGGAGIVFEAKRDSSYSARNALDELDTARANRDACAGVFVMAKSHAPDGFPRFARYGKDVLVVWDDSDPGTDAYLHAAILLGLGLATRGKTVGEQGDLEALLDIEGRIEDELRRLDKMEKHNEGIRRNSDGIAEEIRKAQRQLDLLVRKAKSVMKAFKIELHDEEAERNSPIMLTDNSLDEAAGALSIRSGRQDLT
jgi:hypothetical protein